ncbi:hypothetical protein [Aquimarina aquimarini]|uniref:hypothetical protein n=1 Tax=Aquimarina aquimarini TaxID=1191734 RepID=UPI001F3A3262|nr:hypothetical protein [Aquimarina aquimarini]
MRYIILLVLVINCQNLFSQKEQLYPYYDGTNWGLSDGADLEVTILDTDSISPIFVQIMQKKKLYKSFNKKNVSLVDEKGNVLVTGYEDYKSFSGYKLNKNLVLCSKGEKVGIYDLDKKKEVIPTKYKKISDRYDSQDNLFFVVENAEKAKGLINTAYKTIVTLDKKWKSIYIEEMQKDGKKIDVIQLNDNNYDATYMYMDGKKMPKPVVDSNDDSIEDTIIEMVEEEDYMSSGGLRCKHKDELITTEEGVYQIKSCKQSNTIDLPKGYKIKSLLNPKKNLESDFAYISYKKKIGIYSILSKKIVVDAKYDQLDRIKDGSYFLGKKGKYVGLEYLYKNYDGEIEQRTITQPLFVKIEKSKELYKTFIISLPKNIRGYMVVQDKKTIYLPKSIKAKYKIQ